MKKQKPAIDFNRFKQEFLYSQKIKALTDRLNNSDRIAARMVAEGANIPPADYFARLRKQRSKLIKENKRQGLPKLNMPSQVRRAVRQSSNTALDQLAEIARMWLMFSQDFRDDVQCHNVIGSVLPFFHDEAIRIEELHHDSTASIKFDESFMGESGTVFCAARLNDDDALWRNDNPDFIFAGYVCSWRFPRVPCDALMLVKIRLDHHIEITTDGAALSDVGSFFITKGSPDGEPVEVHTSDMDLLLGGSGHESITISETMNVKKGAEPTFHVFHGLGITAQDGEVGVLAQFSQRRADSSSDLRPKMRYERYPLAPVDIFP